MMWTADADAIETKINNHRIETDKYKNYPEKIDLIEPTIGKIYFEHKNELIFCKPRLMPIKSQALERLEEIQRQTANELLKKRTKQGNNNNTKVKGDKNQ